MKIKMYYLAWGRDAALCSNSGLRCDGQTGEYKMDIRLYMQNYDHLAIDFSREALLSQLTKWLSEEALSPVNGAWHIKEVEVEI